MSLEGKDALEFFKGTKDESEEEPSCIIKMAVLPENLLVFDLFRLCDLKIKATFGGVFATGFSTGQIIDLMDTFDVEKDRRIYVLEALKIAGKVHANYFNEKSKSKK